MLFGLAGASRAGKTTLGTTVAEELGITFLSNNTPDVAARHGYNAVGTLTLGQRLELQKIILEEHIALIEGAERPLIIDRTPLDFAAYLLAEFEMLSAERTTPQVIAEVEAYVNTCLNTTKRFYDFVFFVGQLDDYKEETGKHGANRAYQTHHSLIIEGLLARLNNQLAFAYIYEPDFETRRSFMHETITDRLDAIDTLRRSAAHVH